MARQNRATSHSTGIRGPGAALGEVSAPSRAIRRARAFATDAQLAMRAQLARCREVAQLLVVVEMIDVLVQRVQTMTGHHLVQDGGEDRGGGGGAEGGPVDGLRQGQGAPRHHHSTFFVTDELLIHPRVSILKTKSRISLFCNHLLPTWR